MNDHRSFFILIIIPMKKLTVLLLIILCAGFGIIKATPLALNDDFNNVIKNYLALKNALVTDNAPMAQANAANLLAAISTVSNKDMNAAQRKTWLAYADKLTFDARHISESNNIDHKREHFATLSNNFLAVIKAFNINKATLYKQYCPMKNSYWLSEANTVKNPYYGNSMLTCGTVQETFAAVK